MARSDLPRCPRCRYDLSGEVASWADRCPLRVRCPECGVVSASVSLFPNSRAVGVDPYEGRRIPGKTLFRYILGAGLLVVLLISLVT